MRELLVNIMLASFALAACCLAVSYIFNLVLDWQDAKREKELHQKRMEALDKE